MPEQQSPRVASHLVRLQGTPAAGGHVHGLPRTSSDGQGSQRLQGDCRHCLHQQHYPVSAGGSGVCPEWILHSACCSVWPCITGGTHCLPFVCIHPKGVLGIHTVHEVCELYNYIALGIQLRI